MKKKVKKEIKMPICPYCGEQMSISIYSGRYESFTYWECGCAENELKDKATNQWFGCYA